MKPDFETSKMTAGRVFQINRSDGGVPKLAVQSVYVSEAGMEGDRQNNTDVHGGPDRAVVVYSLEKIIELQEDGHPLFPGALGETLTLTGLDWPQLEPGQRLWVGEVLIEFTSYTNPCSKLASFLIDGDFNRVSQANNPGWSRLSGRVLKAGNIRTGDLVRFA